MQKDKKTILFAILVGLFFLLVFLQFTTRIPEPITTVPEHESIDTKTFRLNEPAQEIPDDPLEILRRSSITITRYPKIDTFSDDPQTKDLNITAERTTKTSRTKPSTPRAKPEISTEEPTAGITKTSKRPPPERIQELNSQGIIIW